MKHKTLTFGNGNAKLSKTILTLSLPAGFTCPAARDCLSKSNPKTGKIVDGKDCQFRCFAASQEAIYPSVRQSRWNNFNLLKSCKSLEEMANLIQSSLPSTNGIVRWHVSGDFFNETYFLAVLNVAINNPLLTIYGYTKMVNFLAKYKKDIPANFRFTASKGGIHDKLISRHKLKSATVVYSPEEAMAQKLPIDHDDSEALYGKSNFALLIHGQQGANTKAAKAVANLRKLGFKGYSEENKKNHSVKKNVTIYVKMK